MLSYAGVRQFETDMERYDSHALFTADQLAKVMPESILTHIQNDQDIVRRLYQLNEKGLLRYFSGFDVDAYFRITTNGIIVFRKFLKPLATAIVNDSYDKIIDKTEGSNAVKKELKALRKKLKDRTEDEIIDAFINVAKTYGPVAILFLVRLAYLQG